MAELRVDFEKNIHRGTLLVILFFSFPTCRQIPNRTCGFHACQQTVLFRHRSPDIRFSLSDISDIVRQPNWQLRGIQLVLGHLKSRSFSKLLVELNPIQPTTRLDAQLTSVFDDPGGDLLSGRSRTSPNHRREILAVVAWWNS